MLQEINYRSNLDGTHIHSDYYATTDPKALIVVIHGMAEHRGRYRELGERFNASGYDVLVPDQRGHGDSPVEGLMGYYGEKKGMERQLYDFIEILKLANEKQLPVYFLGHSMGSLWARFILKRYPNLAQKMLLSGTPAYQKGTQVLSPLVSGISTFSPQKPAGWIARQMNAGFNKSVPNALTEFDWLSFDRDNIAAYMQDPKCGFPFTLAGYAVLMDLMEEIYAAIPGRSTTRTCRSCFSPRPCRQSSGRRRREGPGRSAAQVTTTSACATRPIPSRNLQRSGEGRGLLGGDRVFDGPKALKTVKPPLWRPLDTICDLLTGQLASCTIVWRSLRTTTD